MKNPEPSVSSGAPQLRGPWAWGAALPSHGALEMLKWLALLCMVVDHVGALVYAQGKFSLSYEVGRLAYPLFAMVLACRLVDRTHRLGHLDAAPVWRLVRWALLSALPFFWATGRLWPPDIFFTLALGTALCWLSETACRPGMRIAAHTAAALASFACDYMAPGVYLILATYHWQKTPGQVKAAVGVALCATGLCLLNASLATLVPFALILLAHRRGCERLTAPRMPSLFFYAFYPLHLSALAAWRHFH